MGDTVIFLVCQAVGVVVLGVILTSLLLWAW
jgi:hypothetical protein